MDPQIEQQKLEAVKDDCQTPRRSLDKAYLQLETQLYQPSKEGTANKEDPPRDGNMT